MVEETENAVPYVLKTPDICGTKGWLVVSTNIELRYVDIAWGRGEVSKESTGEFFEIDKITKDDIVVIYPDSPAFLAKEREIMHEKPWLSWKNIIAITIWALCVCMFFYIIPI